MGIDFPNSPSAGDTYTYEGETYRYNGVAFVKVRDRVTTFNGATGAIVGVTSVQGKTGDVTLTDLEITHGVETFNGLSGSIDTTSLVLPVTGISASGGITSNGPSTINGYGFLDTGVVLAPNGLNISLEGDSDIDVKLRSNGISINDNAEAITTTVKGDGDVHLLTVHGSSDKVGIGVQNPQEKLDVNGTIKATTGITLGAGGITFADGTFQKTAAKSGYRYVIDQVGSGALTSTPSTGTIDVTQQFAGIIDKISIHDTDADGNDISSLLTLFADSGGYLQVMTADNLEFFVAHISSADLEDSNLTHTFGSDVFVLQHTSDGIEMIGLDTFESGDEVFVTIVPAAPLVSSITDSTRGTGTNAIRGNIFVDGTPVNSGGLSAGHHSNFNRLFIDDDTKLNLKGVTLGTGHLGFNDGSLQQTATKDVGTFTISASSAISTGAKADALHRIPYNATLTKFELKSKATGGMTAAVYIAGADFGNPTNAFITGATAETTGFTADTTTFGTATVSEGDFVYLHVLANASGATAAQAFVSYETR